MKWNELTEKQRGVALLVGHGKSNEEIARELYISVSTVQYHIRQMFYKLEIHSRSQLAYIVGQQDGLKES